MLLQCALVMAFVPAFCAAQEYEAVKNIPWNFTIEAPKGWVVSDIDAIIKFAEGTQKLSAEQIETIRKSGVLLNVSKNPLDYTEGFNPNLNVSAIKVVQQLTTDEEAMTVARQILAASTQQPAESATELRLEKLIGVKGQMKTPEEAGKGDVAILIDREKSEFFIINYIYKTDEEKQIFERILNSFKRG